MRKALTITVDAKGKSDILTDLDTPFDEQRDQFNTFASLGLPKGAAQVILAVCDAPWKVLDAAKVQAQIAARAARAKQDLEKAKVDKSSREAQAAVEKKERDTKTARKDAAVKPHPALAGAVAALLLFLCLAFAPSANAQRYSWETIIGPITQTNATAYWAPGKIDVRKSEYVTVEVDWYSKQAAAHTNYLYFNASIDNAKYLVPMHFVVALAGTGTAGARNQYVTNIDTKGIGWLSLWVTNHCNATLDMTNYTVRVTSKHNP